MAMNERTPMKVAITALGVAVLATLALLACRISGATGLAQALLWVIIATGGIAIISILVDGWCSRD